MAATEMEALVREKERIESAISIFGNFFEVFEGSRSPAIIEQIRNLVDYAKNSAYALGYNPAYKANKQPSFKRTENETTVIRTVAEYAEKYAEESELFRGDKDIYTLRIQLRQLEAIRNSLEERIKVSEKQLELKKQQLEENGFQRRRNNVARFVAIKRADELTNIGGALNFKEQMKSVGERLHYDLIAAKLRLKKASDGFRMLYGYSAFEENSGSMFTKSYNEKGIYEREFDFDKLVTWTQVTNTWLAAFLDTQQQVTFSFSLKDLVKGAENFGKGIEERNGKLQGEWSFRLTPEDFYERKLVRMRSFSLQVDCGMKIGSWNFKVTPPSKAKNEPIKQDHVGTLFLGRVNERTYAVVPESAAPPKLYNISPIGDEQTNEGKWKIEISNSSTAGTSIEEIIDIDIHLTVALV